MAALWKGEGTTRALVRLMDRWTGSWGSVRSILFAVELNYAKILRVDDFLELPLSLRNPTQATATNHDTLK